MTHGSSAWDHLRKGETEQALALFEDAYAREPEAGNIIRLGIGHLWTKNYEAAWQHFRHAINTYHSPTDIFHGMAGVAKWCINDLDSAVNTWRGGFGAPYTVGASVVRLPLLLFAASILRPKVFPRKEAEGILQERIKNPLVENWPGPLTKLILHILGERDLEPLWVGNVGEGKRGVMPYRRWQTRFYEATLKVGCGDLGLDEFYTLLRRLTDTSEADWSEDRHLALLLQCEEFFLARHEVSLANRRLLNKN